MITTILVLSWIATVYTITHVAINRIDFFEKDSPYTILNDFPATACRKATMLNRSRLN